MNGFGVSRDERMPPEKRLSLRKQPIRTGLGHPAQFCDVGCCYFHAVGHIALSIGVIAALAGIVVEKPTGHIRERVFAGVGILQLEQAALATTVAERFPLRIRHVLESLGLPERFCVTHVAT